MPEDTFGNESDKEGLPDFIHSIKQQKLSSSYWKREELQRHVVAKHRHCRVINQNKVHNHQQLIKKVLFEMSSTKLWPRVLVVKNTKI